MELTFAPNGTLQVDDATLLFRNFRGEGSDYNREGDRNFCLLIDDPDIADRLIESGWNVKIKEPRNPEDGPFMYMKVKVNFNEYGPNVFLVCGSKRMRLTEDNVGILDRIAITNVDLDINPYDWERNGNKGRSAYLDGIEVTQRTDRFTSRYDEMNDEEYTPGM